MALWNETSETVPWETWSDWVSGGCGESCGTHQVPGATTGGASVPTVKVSGLGSVTAQESLEWSDWKFP